jgi:ABC-type uncharacterized transport system fused permease/ATPase subunit
MCVMLACALVYAIVNTVLVKRTRSLQTVRIHVQQLEAAHRRNA